MWTATRDNALTKIVVGAESDILMRGGHAVRFLPIKLSSKTVAVVASASGRFRLKWQSNMTTHPRLLNFFRPGRSLQASRAFAASGRMND